MRVIFVNRFYRPEEPATAQLLADLAEELSRLGHAITVITSHPGGPGVPRRETLAGVEVQRVGRGRRGQTGLAGKAADFARFHLAALWALALTARRDDRIVALTDPPLIGIGAWLVARGRGARMIHWVQDIYPELAMNLTGQRWLRVLRPLRDLAWRRADACVTLGQDMAASLTAAGAAPARMAVMPNWAPAGLMPQPAVAAAGLRREWSLDGRFVIAYSGNLGRVHDLDAVLAVAATLQHEPAFAFVFIGSGPQRARLEALAQARGLTQVQFHPPQPRARLNETLALGDVHLVTLRPGCERLVFPSKLYGIAAVGRPVLVISAANCELARLVVEKGFGRSYAPEAVDAMVTTLRELQSDPAACARLGAAALRYHASLPTPAQAAESWQTLLTQT